VKHTLPGPKRSSSPQRFKADFAVDIAGEKARRNCLGFFGFWGRVEILSDSIPRVKKIWIFLKV
jgi:hypothetical protein